MTAFLHRSKAAASLDHPHIIRIIDFGITSAGEPFIITARSDGRTLGERLA